MLGLRKKSKILILAAHPDDETLGCVSTISRLSSEGHKLHLMTFTNGVGARNKKNQENRNNKLREICGILGIHSFNHGDFPDNGMDSVPLLDVCRYIEDNCPFEPDLVFTHHPDCLNIDHSIVYRASITVFRPQLGKKQTILSYFVPSSTDYNPSFDMSGCIHINTKDFLSKKIEALSVYDEEMRKYPHSRSYQNVKNLSHVWGSEVGLESAEKFKVIRSVV